MKCCLKHKSEEITPATFGNSLMIHAANSGISAEYFNPNFQRETVDSDLDILTTKKSGRI